MSYLPLAVWTPGWLEIVIILAVLLLVFGKRLPDVMRNLGKGLTQFKRGMRDSVDEIKDGMDGQQPQGGQASQASQAGQGDQAGQGGGEKPEA
ncbi:MAG: Sec-independent protein translocase subunit TatA/TatB [Planctomycetota bacterium]|jgi:sec-independent protein translocase protein TatA